MELPVLPPVSPMLAKATGELPEGEGWWFEPKWDGFRCIVFRDGDEVELGSRNERPLTRYFPELVDPIRRSLPGRCVVDGELVVVGAHGLDFDALLQRIHPAESRVRTLAAATPASFVAFDLLALDDDDLRPSPYASRRAALEAALDRARPPIHLTPATTDRTLAADWFERFEGAGLDGVIAKPGDDPYVESKRTQLKVKHQRTADVVVAGYRTHKQGGVGSLLLGLYDDRGTLQHVGVASGFRAADRPRLAEQLAPLRADDDPDHPWATWAGADGADGDRRPGAPSRWNAAKDLSWTPLRPELVAEVAYDHLQGDRFRHATRLVRWRPDRRPESCRYDQLEAPVPIELRRVFGG